MGNTFRGAMIMGDANACGYAEILETLKTYFPVPVSNPILDGYFVHTLSRFLDQVDALKSASPQLAVAHETPAGQQPAFPDAMTSVEDAIDLIVQYCEGMTI